MMNELDEPFSAVDGAFKSSLDKLIPIHDLLPWKTTESVGYDAEWSYEYLISSEITYWSAREGFW